MILTGGSGRLKSSPVTILFPRMCEATIWPWPKPGWSGREGRNMPGSWRAEDLPNLKDGNWTCKSPYKRRYNCIAWAAGDDQNWWCPLVYWPDGVDRDDTIDAYLDAFRTVGYEECADASLEEGFEKVA